MKLSYGKYYSLPRGGNVVKVSHGILQVGAPPETIKDSIRLYNDVPNIYCIGDENFCFIRGLNLSELEFPIYYNFFIKKRKIFIVGTKKQCNTLRNIMNLVLFGKGPVDLGIVSGDYSKSAKYKPPNMKKEISFFANFTIDDMITFKHFDKSFKCEIGSVHINKESDGFNISDLDAQGNSVTLKIPSFDSYQDFYKRPLVQMSPPGFNRPMFGITTLGASHGFDPRDNTSGFVFWNQGRGVLVDPPANFTDLLNKEEINPFYINSLILTHVHADHDSGTFQKILEQSRITFYTTNAIMRLWLYKYSLITGMSISEIKKLFDFVPVRIGEPVIIEGLEFSFRYMFHSLPTIGFTIKNHDFTVTFSSDHLNQPSFFRQLLDEKVIDDDRYAEFMDFPWNSDIILHEAGIPPLHTSVDYLDSLSNDIKRKTYVYHIAKDNFLDKTLLTRCVSGLKNTMVLTTPVETTVKEEQANFLAAIPLFKRFRLQKSEWESLLNESNLIEEIVLPKGNALIPQDFSEHFYVIKSGLLNLHHGSVKSLKLNPVQLFNDFSIVYLDNYSNPDTINTLPAMIKAVLFKINKEKFFKAINKSFNISATLLKKQLKHFSTSLNHKAWEVLEGSELLTLLTPTQRIDFLNTLEQVNVANGKPVKIDVEKQAFFYHSGRVIKKSKKMNLRPGDYLGDPKTLVLSNKSSTKKNQSSQKVLVHADPGSTLFRVDTKFLKIFYQDHPGVRYRISHR